MATVVGLNGQVEIFARLTSPSSDDDRSHDVILRVNEVASSSDGCH